MISLFLFLFSQPFPSFVGGRQGLSFHCFRLVFTGGCEGDSKLFIGGCPSNLALQDLMLSSRLWSWYIIFVQSQRDQGSAGPRACLPPLSSPTSCFPCCLRPAALSPSGFRALLDDGRHFLAIFSLTLYFLFFCLFGICFSPFHFLCIIMLKLLHLDMN